MSGTKQMTPTVGHPIRSHHVVGLTSFVAPGSHATIPTNAQAAITKPRTALVLSFMAKSAKRHNDVRERRGPAATDVRIVSEMNGWSPSAPRKGSAHDLSSVGFF